ncbi:MAG TPA: glycosyltransferase family 39 protein [Anaerolineae bacterium]|nr:glycosyltransferase family 39 protein [Anaerolineae bacterium]
MTTPHASRVPFHVSLITLLLLAFFFRTHELAGLGLGLEHDEVAEWLIADGIRHGQHALFFKEAYGQEPLFLYLMAGSTTLIGDNVIGVRFTSVFIAMFTLAAAHRLLRRIFGPTVALVALAGLSIALWPVFWGRVGLRAMTLPLLLCLGFDCLWRGLNAECGMQNAECRKHFALAGLFVGLSAYTYLSSRAIPILLLALALYLALFARDQMRGRWRAFALFLLIAALVALPLALYLLANPDLQFRVAEVSAPLDKALAGDASELLANIPRTWGMFTVRGDGTVRDNWPDRPIFPEPLGALLFILGFALAALRFRRLPYALAVIWIGAMLIPTVVTAGAPNFTRALGALPMVFALPGIAVEWLWRNLVERPPLTSSLAWRRSVAAFSLVGVFGLNAASTYRDYFNQWPAHPETQFVFQADLAAIAADIDASDVMDVSVGGLSNDTLDDPSLYLLRRRKDVRVRWFDPGSPLSSSGAILQPNGASGRVYVPAIVPLSPDLEQDLQSYPDPFDHFQRYEANSNGNAGIPLSARYFDDTAILVSPAGEPVAWRVTAGAEFQFETRWIAQAPIAYPRRIFVHVVDPRSGQTLAQHDGLDSPTRFWRAGDRIVQVHTSNIAADTPPGRYEIRLGLYDPVSGQRVQQTDRSRIDPPSDYVAVGTIEVTR